MSEISTRRANPGQGRAAASRAKPKATKAASDTAAPPDSELPPPVVGDIPAADPSGPAAPPAPEVAADLPRDDEPVGNAATGNGEATAGNRDATAGNATAGNGVPGHTVASPEPSAQNPFGHYPFQASAGPNPPGWYPDTEDSAGLRFWDGVRWTEHRARLAVPAMSRAPLAPAVCECGVVAVGSCRVCSRPYCRAHISEQPTEDRAFLLRWEAWTCLHCLEDDQRAARARQLARCENVAAQIAMIPKMSRVRTITGLRPRLVNLFQRSDIAGMRPARHARAYLIEYDGGEPDSTYLGLAISATGETVYDVGAKVRGVPTSRVGPKVTIQGYLIRKEITIDALREASARSTKDSWFEFASRAYLRAGKRLGIKAIDPDS